MKDVVKGIVDTAFSRIRHQPDRIDKVISFLSSGDVTGIVPGGVNEFRLGGINEVGEATMQPVLHMGPDTNAFITPTQIRRKGFLGRKATVIAIASPASPLQTPGMREPRRSFFLEPLPINKIDKDMVVIFDISTHVSAHQNIRSLASQAREQLYNQFPPEERAHVYSRNGSQS